MRVLTVRQPWAWAIVHGGKDVENRTRNVAGGYRGPVAILAGLKLDENASGAALFDAYDDAIERGESWGWRSGAGHIIGVVDLVGVHDSRMDGCGTQTGTARLGQAIPLCSEWAEPWAHHLVLANPRPLAEPLPFRGGLGLRRLDGEVEAEILRRVA